MERPSPSMSSRHSLSPPMSPNKPLPIAPDSMTRAVQSVTPQTHSSASQTRLSSRNSSQMQPKAFKNPSKKVKQVETVSAVSQATPASIPARRTSFSERTRSLTRKLSFFKDRQENETTHVDSSSTDPSSRKPRTKQSSPSAPDAVSTAAHNPLKSDSSHRTPPSNCHDQAHPSEKHSYNSPPAASSSTVEAITSDSSRELPQNLPPISVPSASPTNHFQGLAQDTGDRTTILFVGSHHSRQALSESWTYPSKPLDTATVHTVKSLPLRNYHSSETLQENAFDPSSNQAYVNFPPKRRTSSQNSPINIHLSPPNWSSPPSSVSVSPPTLSTAPPSAKPTPSQTRLDSISATSDDGDTLRAVPIAPVSPQSDHDTGPSPITQPFAAPPAIPRPTPNSQTTPPPSDTIATYNGAASSAPLIEFLLSNPAPATTNRSQVPSAHSRGPSGHSTKSTTTVLHHRQYSGPDSRRPHIIHPSISHEDIKALGKREEGSHNKMVIRRPSGWKRVFSNGLGGHKKSKSENHPAEKVLGLRTVNIDPPRTTATGKDGVWISRKNFLKT